MVESWQNIPQHSRPNIKATMLLPTITGGFGAKGCRFAPLRLGPKENLLTTLQDTTL